MAQNTHPSARPDYNISVFLWKSLYYILLIQFEIIPSQRRFPSNLVMMECFAPRMHMVPGPVQCCSRSNTDIRREAMSTKKETENTSLALQMMLIILSNLCAERDRAKENRMKCVSSSVLLIRMPHNGHTRTATTVTQAYIWSIDGRDCRTN